MIVHITKCISKFLINRVLQSITVYHVQEDFFESGLFQGPVIQFKLLYLLKATLQFLLFASEFYFLVTSFLFPLYQIALPITVLQLHCCAFCSHPSFVHDEDSIAEAFCFFHIMCCYENGAIAVSQLQDDLPCLKSNFCIHSSRGLIKDDEFRVSDQANGQRQSPSHSSRKGGHLSIPKLIQFD